jgi:hypothetical protein
VFIAAAVVSSLLAAAIAFAAARKLSHRPEVVESYARAGFRRTGSTSSHTCCSPEPRG